MKVSAFIATSLDGFISRKNGDIGWLNEANKLVPAGEDCGYSAFSKTVDAHIIGRKTFEQVLSFNMWPYGKKTVIVLSGKEVEIPPNLPETVTSTKETPSELSRRLSGEGFKHLYIDGGMTIQSFLREGLLDEITITIIPLLLGEGNNLFGPLATDIKLRKIDTKSYEFGFVQIKYRVTKS